MSFVARDKTTGRDEHRSRFSRYEDDNADQHEEYQSTRSELPVEIPDSRPDPYLPAEIPDSQPDLIYHEDLPFGDLDYSEVSSQLPTRDHGDLRLGDASAFDLGDYDLDEEETVDPGKCNLDGYKKVDHGVPNKAFGNSSSGDTEIIPGGTRLIERRKGRIVSLYHHSPNPATLLSIYFESS